MNLNKAFIMGNLTRDPELKTLPSGSSVASFGIATNRVWKDQSGQRKEDTQFHNIVVFGRQADTSAQYLKKGSLALIEGRIQTRSWDAPDGTKRYRTEIVAERVQFGPKKRAAGGADESMLKKEEVDTIEYPEDDINPEDIPF
jgi:single-strand DNA-binding protein